ncbi:MAG: tRNA pseudouridine(38-40) synthase TruA [bacterium]
MDRNHRMELQYAGTGFHGWAKQDGLITVEGCLEAALSTVLGDAHPIRVAGRTDAGVHARRQVASVHLPEGTDLARLVRSLNALTPPGIAVTRITPVAVDFDPRKDAVRRVYRYFLCAAEVVPPFWVSYAWHVVGGIDLSAMRESAALVVGSNDFTAFTPRETEHVFFRRLVSRCAWKQMRGGSSALSPATAEAIVFLEIEADAFLRHMVRTLVGTMVEVGEGTRSVADFGRLLGGAARETAGRTAPAHGLFLWDVGYRKRRS